MHGRLSTLQAAFVIARRDFTAILFSRSFVFFLLGPLFPLFIGAVAGGIGSQVSEAANEPLVEVSMSEADAARMIDARASLSQTGVNLPVLRTSEDQADELSGRARASLTGTLSQPVLTGPEAVIAEWRGPISLIAAQARGDGPRDIPAVALRPVKSAAAGNPRGNLLTAQAGQTLLFLLTMLLAGMVLSNLVEEKGNKIIEILAAAIPMDAVFFGKLFAMLAVSFVGIAVWGTVGTGLFLAARDAFPAMTPPAVGWPMFFALGALYFASAYLLLGSVFLSIGSLAATVREVQTISMPVTMLQLMVFFLASYAMTQPGSPAETFAVVFPFSSPFAMLARAAQDAALWPHALALGWQVLCVVVFVRIGARLFRSRVMKSGQGPASIGKKRRLFARKAASVPR